MAGFDPVFPDEGEWPAINPIAADPTVLPNIPAGSIGNDKISSVSPLKIQGIGAKAYSSSAQSVGDSSAEMLSMNTTVFDEGGFWSASAPTRLTFPFAGVYQISGYAKYAADADGYRRARLTVGGSTELITMASNSIGAGSATQVFVSTSHRAAAGDYVELELFHTAGGDIDVEAGVSANFLVAIFQFPI